MKPALSPTLVRFAGVGVVNTALDLGLFLLLHDRLGIVLANFVSTSAGMTFSFVVNGLFTFSAGRLTLRHALLFLASTGTVMWLFQPVVIHVLADVVEPLLVVKVLSIGVSFVANFVAYRYVVWPTTRAATES
ncbi:GtrA family protein [Nocardioides sp. 1609]|uniref:GtrA family protein n=1 Tax=Nocardioides sp. 1609 TaxID=2508327 RepID=UPI00106FDA12|nr:GtrA family protein [Nocardioides sp. 1609]